MAKATNNRIKYVTVMTSFVFSAMVTTTMLPVLGSEDSISLSITEAINAALKQNLDLRRGTNEIESYKIEKERAKAHFLPDLRLSGHSSWSSSVKGEESESFSSTASSSLNLFNGFGDVSELRAARAELQGVLSDYERDRQGIVYWTIRQFIEVISAGEYVRIEEENLITQENLLQQMEAFHEAGKISKADVYQQKADIKQSELQVLNAERNWEVGRIELLKILAEPADATMEFQPPEIEAMTSAIAEYSPSFSLEDVLANRDDYKAYESKMKTANERIKAAQSGYWPSISLSAGAGSSYRDSDLMNSFYEQFWENNPYLQIGLSLSFPIFDQAARKSSLKKAQIQLSNQEIAFRSLKLEIESELQQAILDFRTALKEREAAYAKRDYAREALIISQERYRVGTADYVQLSQARASFLNAAYQQIDADYGLFLQYTALHYYIGDIDKIIEFLNEVEGRTE